MGWDRRLFWEINHLSAATGWAHGVLAGYALWGGLVALTCVWAACWLVAWRRDDGLRSISRVILTGAATLVALGLTVLIGPLVDRPRPFVAMPHVLFLLPHASDPSFPSDHATIAGAFAGGLVLVHRRWGIVAAVLAVLTAFARVYAGVHYPTDVLAGLLLGALVAVALVGWNAGGLLLRPLEAIGRGPVGALVTRRADPAGVGAECPTGRREHPARG